MAERRYFPSTRPQSVKLQFLKELPEYETIKPYHISGLSGDALDFPRTNIQYQELLQDRLYNLRGVEANLSIADHGFQIIQVPSETAFLDIRGRQQQEYIEEITRMVKRLLGASFALCYDCKFRSSGTEAGTQTDVAVGTARRPDTPAEVAHIDLTPDGAARRARRHLTDDEARTYLNDDNWRMRAVNVWRPFDIVHSSDLLYCDFTTVRPGDIVAVDRVSTEYVGEVYMLKPRHYYEWYFIDHQKPTEATLFLSYDSEPQSGAPFCPHTSVTVHNSSSSRPPRESVELRIILFSPRQAGTH